MAAENNDSKKQEEKEQRYRSRYDANRKCYRKDKTHYVYEKWVEVEGAHGFYQDIVLTVGEDKDVTLELLDFLQATDNSEVADQQDESRNKRLLSETVDIYVKSREEELCSEEEHISPELKTFNEKVRQHLSEEQMDLIYARYGMNMTLEEIATQLPPNQNGTPKTHQAVSSRLNRIIAKVRKYMTEE